MFGEVRLEMMLVNKMLKLTGVLYHRPAWSENFFGSLNQWIDSSRLRNGLQQGSVAAAQ